MERCLISTFKYYIIQVFLLTKSPPPPSLQTEAEKQASLTVLEKKLQPMEDQFSEFTVWLAGSEVSLSSLSPPSDEDSERAQQLTSAKVSFKLKLHNNTTYVIVN